MDRIARSSDIGTAWQPRFSTSSALFTRGPQVRRLQESHEETAQLRTAVLERSNRSMSEREPNLRMLDCGQEALRFGASMSYPIPWRTASSPSNRRSHTFSIRPLRTFCVDRFPQGTARSGSQASRLQPPRPSCPQLTTLASFFYGMPRIFTQYSTRTSSSISAPFPPYRPSPPHFLGPDIQNSSPVATSS